MADDPVDTMIAFRFGEAFPVGDVVAEWLATLTLAFNDIAYVHRQLAATSETGAAYEYFYFLRLAIGHFNEACASVDGARSVPDVAAYVDSLGTDARNLYGDCLSRYRNQSSVIAQVRNLSAFHYPDFVPSNQRRPMLRALRDLADERTWMFKSATKTIGDSRLLFGDDIQSKLFTWATATDDALFAAHAEINDAIQSFMRFTNLALDEWWARRVEAGLILHYQPGKPQVFGKALEGIRAQEPPIDDLFQPCASARSSQAKSTGIG